MIMPCNTSTYFSVAINGSPEGWIKKKRGLRQGDLLPPYLFVLGNEMLSRMCKLACKIGFLNFT